MRNVKERCSICGRFVPWEADSGVPFGNSGDINEPEPKWFCARCAESQKQRILDGDLWLASIWYRRPHWVEEALMLRDDELFGNDGRMDGC